MTKTEMMINRSSGPGRPKYKEMWKASLDEYAECKERLIDCEYFIKEAKDFIVEHGLSEEFNKILNDKYGMTLATAILSIR